MNKEIWFYTRHENSDTSHRFSLDFDTLKVKEDSYESLKHEDPEEQVAMINMMEGYLIEYCDNIEAIIIFDLGGEVKESTLNTFKDNDVNELNVRYQKQFGDIVKSTYLVIKEKIEASI